MSIKQKIITLLKNILNVDFWFLILAFFSIFLAFNKIVLDIGFAEIPIFFLLFGIISYLINPRISLYLFVFLLPIVSAFPYFYPNGFPYNYMAVVLFYLSGILIASIIRREKMDFNFSWSIYYLYFLIILWISALFVFLKWSNITLNSLATLKDTLTEPGGTRVSFSSIFPILTLFLFSVSPYIAILLRKNKIFGERIFLFLLPGYCVSVLISLYQMFVDHFFLKMKMKYWQNEVDQFSGGASDFNSFGFFSGAMFLSIVIFLIKYFCDKNGNKPKSIGKISFYITGIIFSLTGIFVSGSRAAFIFILSALFLFFLSKQVKGSFKIIVLIVIIVSIVVMGGVLKERVSDTFEKISKSFSSDNIIQSLDKASNGRIKMFQNSSMIFEKYSIAGVGTGGFLFYLKNFHYKKKDFEDLPLNHYLLIFDEGGVIGLFAFLLFLIVLAKNFKKSSYLFLLLTIYIVLFFNNFFWFPEILVLFWIIASLGDWRFESVKPITKRKVFITAGLMVIFVIANILTFDELHPLNITATKNIPYDYGFWYPEKDSKNIKYNWTKAESGVYIYLKNDISKKIELYCGAPLARIKGKIQNVEIYWRGKLYDKITFSQNQVFSFQIKDNNYQEGFLEFRVNPVFNLKKMNLSSENRTLGVQIYIKE